MIYVHQFLLNLAVDTGTLLWFQAHFKFSLKKKLQIEAECLQLVIQKSLTINITDCILITEKVFLKRLLVAPCSSNSDHCRSPH